MKNKTTSLSACALFPETDFQALCTSTKMDQFSQNFLPQLLALGSSLGLLHSAAVEVIPCSERKNLPSPVTANTE